MAAPLANVWMLDIDLASDARLFVYPEFRTGALIFLLEQLLPRRRQLVGFVDADHTPLGLLSYTKDFDDDDPVTYIEGLYGTHWDAMLEEFLHSDHGAGRQIRVKQHRLPAVPGVAEKLQSWGFRRADEDEDDDEDDTAPDTVWIKPRSQ